MTKILVVFTGGTIGSRTVGSSIDVHADSGFELIRKYEEQYGKQAEFETIQPFTILSENIVPQDWEVLYRSIVQCDPSRYDGIIINHGSDTLAYSAAAVSFMFARTSIPILLTASNYPLDDPRSEGVRNFAGCVSMIVNDPLPGIFVVFEDSMRRTIVHLGTRIMQSQPFIDQFASIYDAPFGEVQDSRLHVRASKFNPDVRQLQSAAARTDQLPSVSFGGHIVYLRPYPGLRYSNIDVHSKKPQAVLLELYHSGTTGIRSVSEEDALEPFIARCKEEGIEVYIAPIKNPSGNLYASSHELLSYGVIPLANMSVEAALVKLMLAYGSLRSAREIQQLLKRNLFFEIVE